MQFAPVAIVFRTAGEDRITAAGASPSVRRGFTGNENPLSRRAEEPGFYEQRLYRNQAGIDHLLYGLHKAGMPQE